jgi:hypothetical protein
MEKYTHPGIRDICLTGGRALPDEVYPSGYPVIHALQVGGLRPTRYIYAEFPIL